VRTIRWTYICQPGAAAYHPKPPDRGPHGGIQGPHHGVTRPHWYWKAL